MCKPTGYFSRSKLYGHTKSRIPGLQPRELIRIPLRGSRIQSRTTGIQSRKKLHARFRVEESGKPVQGAKESTIIPTAIPASQPGPIKQEKPTNIEELLLQFIQETRFHQKSTDAAIRNLEVQMGQLAQDKAKRPTRTFGANTEKNPKEECKVVLT